MQTPSIFEQDPSGIQRSEQLYTDTNVSSTETEQIQPDTREETTEPTPTTIIATGETFQWGDDGQLYIAGNPVIQILPQGLPTHFLCRVQVNDTAQEHMVAASDLLLISTGQAQVPSGWHAEWFSAYIRARSALRACIEIVFTETPIGAALHFAWGSEEFLQSLEKAKEQLPQFPAECPEVASLFAACLCLRAQLFPLIDRFGRLDLTPFVTRILGGQALLDALSQIEQAYVQLPAFCGSPKNPHPTVDTFAPMTGQPTREHYSIIRKEDEAPQLRDEIMKQVELQQPLFLGMITLGLTLLSLAVQPNISGLIAAFLPLTALALALALNIHSLRTGQINFIQRYVLHSPYEIVRRYLFDGQYPGEAEWQILREQGIEISQDMLKAARKLRPPFRNQRSVANWVMFLSFEGLAIAVLILRTSKAFWHGDLLTIISWAIAIAATMISVIVLKQTRVRKSL